MSPSWSGSTAASWSAANALSLATLAAGLPRVVLDTQRGMLADNFYAERLYTRDGLRRQLSSLGYVEISESQPVLTTPPATRIWG